MTGILFGDLRLAQRLEAAEAANARGTSGRGTACLEAAGGCAIFAGAESPLTHAVGVGLNGPVSRTQFDEIEAFFRSRGARPLFEVCPLAAPEFLAVLSERGYRIAEFNNVLVRRLDTLEPIATPRIRQALPAEEDLWSYTVGRGFFEHSDLSEDEMNIGRAIFGMPGVACFLGSVEPGQEVSAAALSVHDGVAILFADSTIGGFRRAGLHRESIAARLAESVARGADLATASTLPGSGSQRNYERMGFQVVYTRVTLAGTENS